MAQTAGSSRMAWVDNMRTFIILLVVNMHACVTYSHVGGWYLKLPPEPDLALKIPFLIWQGHLQAFFMGLLFFIAGYFSEKSLAKKGRADFLRERLIRLGLPTLFFMLVLRPLTVWGIMKSPPITSLPQLLEHYSRYLTSGYFIGATGPLWFAFALLIFSFAFAALRDPKLGQQNPCPAPRAIHLILFCFVLVGTTFAIRFIFPLGTDVINFQLGFFPQYIFGFWLGALSARHSWLQSLAESSLAKRAGIAAVIGGPILLATVIGLGGPPGKDSYPYAGGLHWQAFGLAGWEQMTGPALGLGVIYLFRQRFNFENGISNWLSKHSFGVYVLHTPILVALSYAFQPWQLDPFTGSFLLTATGLTLSYAAAAVFLCIPGFKWVL